MNYEGIAVCQRQVQYGCISFVPMFLFSLTLDNK